MSLPHDWVGRYLERIAARRPAAADLPSLNDLVRRHLEAVPFENLDIGRKRPIVLTTERVISKVVLQRRGGFCYEVNEAFRALLSELGYTVRRIEGRVWSEPRAAYGQPFDHLALVVTLDDGDHLVDVGFGSNARRPLRLPDGTSEDDFGHYRIRTADAPGLMLVERSRAGADGHARPLYEFTLDAQSLDAYEAGCAYHQTSPQSIFTKGPLCTLATAQGRVTLSGTTLVESSAHDRRESQLIDEAQRADALYRLFGIVLAD